MPEMPDALEVSGFVESFSVSFLNFFYCFLFSSLVCRFFDLFTCFFGRSLVASSSFGLDVGSIHFHAHFAFS